MRQRLIWLVVAAMVLILAVLPLAISLDAAFRAETRFGLADRHSLDAFIDVFTGSDYLDALWQTIVMSSAVTALCLIGGVIAAVLIARTDLPGKSALDLLVVMPMFLSPFTGLISWVALGSAKTGFLNTALHALLAPLGIDLPPLMDVWTYGGTIWVMFLFFLPFVYLFTLGSLRSMDGALEEAARSVGASPLGALCQVTLPLCLPAILASGLVVFALTAETYTIPGEIGNYAGFTVLSWQIFLDATGASVHQAHAASAALMLVLVVVAALFLQRRITRRSSRYVTVSGKGFSGRLLGLGRWRWAAFGLVMLYILFATVLPFAALLLSSFLKNSTAIVTSDMLTTEHYRQFFSNQDSYKALTNTLFLAISCGAICVAAGFVISIADLRVPSFATRLLVMAASVPVAVPGLVYGIGILWLSLKSPLYGTIWVLLGAYIAKFVPFGVMMSRGGLQQIHSDLESSARMSGASATRAMWDITLPLIRLTLMSSAFCIMLLCIKELSASAMLYTARSEVLSVLTWHYMDSGNTQFAAVVGVIQTVMMLAIVVGLRAAFGVKLESTMGRGGA